MYWDWELVATRSMDMAVLLLDLQQRGVELLHDRQHARAGAIGLLIGLHVGQFLVQAHARNGALARLRLLQAVVLRGLVRGRGLAGERDVLVDRRGIVAERAAARAEAARGHEILRVVADILQRQRAAGIAVADDAVARDRRGIDVQLRESERLGRAHDRGIDRELAPDAR